MKQNITALVGAATAAHIKKARQLLIEPAERDNATTQSRAIAAATALDFADRGWGDRKNLQAAANSFFDNTPADQYSPSLFLATAENNIAEGVHSLSQIIDGIEQAQEMEQSKQRRNSLRFIWARATHTHEKLKAAEKSITTAKKKEKTPRQKMEDIAAALVFVCHAHSEMKPLFQKIKARGVEINPSPRLIVLGKNEREGLTPVWINGFGLSYENRE